MRPPGNNTRPIIFGFVLVIGITLTLPHFAFGAARSFGGSGRFRGSMIQRQQSFLRPFHDFDSSGRFRAPGFHRQDFFLPGFGFVGGVGGFGDQPVIIIQQFQPAPVAQSSEAAENRIYVQPRWVDGGTEYRSYSRDTGPIRSKRQGVDAHSAQGLTNLALNLHQPGASVNNEVLRQEVQS